MAASGGSAAVSMVRVKKLSRYGKRGEWKIRSRMLLTWIRADVWSWQRYLGDSGLGNSNHEQTA